MENTIMEITKKREDDKGKISIIIPVYNTENYLEKCISSVINQSYTNLEILLVDDGSTDGSGIICDKYAKKDQRVKVFHKKNGGASTARNLGLRYAKGEFIGFVDSDDYIDFDMYEILLKEMDEDVDMVSCGTMLEFPSRVEQKKYITNLVRNCKKYTKEEGIEQLLLDKAFCFSQCDKLFRKELFNNVVYPKGRTSEDFWVLFNIFLKCRNVVHCGKVKYHYVYREDSNSRQKFFYRRIDHVIFSEKICKKVCIYYPYLKRQAESFFIKRLAAIINQIQMSENRKKYISLERKLTKKLLKLCIRNFKNAYIEKEQREICRKIIYNRLLNWF